MNDFAMRFLDGIEITAADLDLIRRMLDLLDRIANEAGPVEPLTVTFQSVGGDTFTVGCGENGDPAVIAIRRREAP